MSTRTLIMAVPWMPERAERARALAIQVHGEIVWDETRSGWNTWKKLLHEAGTDPVIMMEDDVYTAPFWRKAVEDVISYRTDSLVKFSCFVDERTGNSPSPCLKRPGWRKGDKLFGSQCLYFPAGMARSVLQEIELHRRYHPDYDIALGEHLTRHDLRYWQHVPSLVQHERWTSAVDARRAPRICRDFEGVS